MTASCGEKLGGRATEQKGKRTRGHGQQNGDCWCWGYKETKW